MSHMDLSLFDFSVPIQTRFRDMDAFNHINNAVYLTYFEVARTHYWRNLIQWDWGEMGVIVARAEIDFLKPIILSDEIRVYVRTSRVGSTSFDLEYIIASSNEGVEVLYATGKTVCVSFDYKTNKPTPIPFAQRENMLRDSKDSY